MKIEEITAYKSQDGSIWENKADAINNNIDDLIRANLNSEHVSTELIQAILSWFKQHPSDIKYIQTNLKNLEPQHFG